MPFNDEGDFRELFTSIGWGFFPGLFEGAASLLLTWYALDTLPQTLPPEELAAHYQSHVALQVAGFIGIVTLLWQGLLWTFAVSKVRKSVFKGQRSW